MGSNIMMSLLSTLSLTLITIGHLVFGIGNFFQIWLSQPSNILVSGQPGKGLTPMENLLSSVFGIWYLSSLFPVLISAVSSSQASLQGALLCPIIYHICSTLGCMFFLPNLQVYRGSLTMATVFHAIMTVCCAGLLIQ